MIKSRGSNGRFFYGKVFMKIRSTASKRWGRIVALALLFAYTAAIMVSVILFFSLNHGDFSTYEMEKGWDVRYHGVTYYDISKLDRRFYTLESKKNDVLVMKRKLDIKTQLLAQERLTLRVYSRLSSIRVSVIDKNGKDHLLEYYGYDVNSFHSGDFLGSGYHFVQLPQRSYGQTLKIMVMASQDGAIQGLPEVLVTPSNHAMEEFAQERSVGIFITVFMFIAGSVLLIFAVGMSMIDLGFLDLALLGIYSAFGGLWCLCSMKGIELFSQDIRTDSLVEYISLYIFVIPLIGLALRFFKKIPIGLRVCLFVSMCLNIALAIGAAVMQKLGIANVDYMLPLFHMLLAFDTLALTSISFFCWKKSTFGEKFFEGSIFAAAGFGIAYIIYYYFSKWWDMDPSIFDKVIMPMAFLLMVTLILIGYIIDVYAKRVDDRQREKLETLAYKDDLTGLSNRTVGEDALKKLDARTQDYLLVNLDLNFLKKANDSFGHAGGDLYLKSFAEIMRKVFSDAQLLCRMGGDEFMVVYDQNVPDRNRLRQSFDEMIRMEAVVTESLPIDITVDASYGYAYSDEVPDAAGEDIYKLADSRMYEMKFQSRKARRD